MHDAQVLQSIEFRYATLAPLLDERLRRQWAAAEARALGWGGVIAVSRATGIARNTIARGVDELHACEQQADAPVSDRLRGPGGGRKSATINDPALAQSLRDLVDPATRGDPMSPLRWTCKSTTQQRGLLDLT